MPFNTTKPADHTPLDSAEMRGQLTALFNDIQQRATISDLTLTVNNALTTTSGNTNSVATLNLGAEGAYNQAQMQEVMNKLDELITTLRRL